MDIRIKKADVADSGALYALSKAAFCGDCATEDEIYDSLRDNGREIVYIAYAGGLPAGFLCAEVCRSMCCKIAEGKVNELFVDEKCRRQGVASKLLRQAEIMFISAGVSIIEIATSVNNHAAQALYSGCGYAKKTRLIYHRKAAQDG